MIPFPPPLTISLSPIHIPLLFPFFVYFFHCLLLPLHFPINRSLFLFTNSQIHTQWGGTNPPLSLLHHIFHSLVFRVLKASRRRKGGCTITIITINFVHHHHHLAAHGLDYLLSRIQGFVVFKSSCYSIWCNLTFPLIILMNSSLLLDYSLY